MVLLLDDAQNAYPSLSNATASSKCRITSTAGKRNTLKSANVSLRSRAASANGLWSWKGGTVHLHDERGGGRAKIYNVLADDDLPSELHAQLFAAQAVPERRIWR